MTQIFIISTSPDLVIIQLKLRNGDECAKPRIMKAFEALKSRKIGRICLRDYCLPRNAHINANIIRKTFDNSVIEQFDI